MSKRRNHDAGFKARVALEAVKGARTVSELAAEYGVHPTMIHQWSEPLSAIDGVDGSRSRHRIVPHRVLSQPTLKGAIHDRYYHGRR